MKNAFDLKANEIGIINEILIENGVQRRRLYELGFIPDTEIMRYGKLGDIIAFQVKSAIIALRKSDAKLIMLK